MDVKHTGLHRVVPTVVIYKPDRSYLITKRSDKLKVFPGRWTVPGGGFDVSDYIDTKPGRDNQWYGALDLGLRREVREETSLEIGKPEYLLNVAFIRPDGIAVLVLSFYAPYISGDVKLSDEDVDFRWVKVEELDKYDLIADIADEIRMADKIIKGK